MPLYDPGRESISTTDPTGSSDGSAAATPLCTATPAVVIIPLQYAVALNATRSPGTGSAIVSWRVASRAAYFESRMVTSYKEAKAMAAIAVTIVFPQNERLMIIACTELQNCSAIRQFL